MQVDNPTTVILAIITGTSFGFISIPHCIGMCGPLHLTMCLANSKRSFKSLTLFNLGRIFGYTCIGALCGLFGNQLANLLPAPQAEQSKIEVPKSCCEQKAETPAKITVPKSCCEQKAQPPKKISVPTSCCAAKAEKPKPPAKTDVPMSCCAKKAEASKSITVPKSCCEKPTATTPKPRIGLSRKGRQILMYVFPALILILVGIKGLLKKPASVGSGSGGLVAKLFTKFKFGGPSACGVAASFLPCGVLYVAFAIAVGTLSPLLGGVMLFFYCLTITFFMQLGIMVGTTFGKRLGPKVDTFFPWLAFTGAAVYLFIFFRNGGLS
jgi:sulfite exporter TauE/SafE